MRGITQGIAASAARVLVCIILSAAAAHAATITVNSVDDDVFPSNTGAVTGTPAKCTLRMAIAAANLDVAVGAGATVCAAGSGADTIVFDPALFTSTARTITLASVAMSEAPATYASPNIAALAVSRPLTITGPGSSLLTIDGNVAGNDGRRPILISDGVDNTDFAFKMTGVRFYRGRTLDLSSGCMFSGESLELDDMIFENCESVGGGTNNGFGGALGAGSLLTATVAPTIIISNSKFLGNRAVRGTSANRPDNGAAFFGSGIRKVGAVTLTNVLFNGNSAERQGAMIVQNAASVVISGSHFIGNAATGAATFPAGVTDGNGRYGGFLVSTVSGNVTINNATRVNGNVANEERGGFGVLTVGGTVTIDKVDVTGNYVNRDRIGGFEVQTDTFTLTPTGFVCDGAQLRPVNISNVRVQGNSVAASIAGMRIECSGAVAITDAWIVGNETRGYRIAQSDVVSTSISGARFRYATEASAASSTLALTGVTFENNSTDASTGGGGGIVMSVFGMGSFTADSLRMVNNFMSAGSGLQLQANGAGRNYVISNSEFSNNTALGATALFIQTDGNYTLRNSTVSANEGRTGPGSSGRTIAVNANTNTPNGISVAIEHSTIARNRAPSSEAFGVLVSANQPNPGVLVPTLFGGGNATISVKNSILGTRAPGSLGISTVTIDPTVTNVTAMNSLLEFTGGAPALASFCAGTGMKCNVGSLVSPIAGDAGSNSTRTMALMAGSPAINAGGAVLGGLTTDQRGAGFPRVVGATVDMGAYEATPATTYGCTLDIDGNGGPPDALTDGLLLLRALFGLTGTSVTTGAVGAAPTRGNWTAIQTYLNANCGTSLAP
ncbi:MAG: choice-of-anchor Q domain-containing protein [Betaproteobacteria bacterium]